MKRFWLFGLLLFSASAGATVTNLTVDGSTPLVRCGFGQILLVSVRGTIGGGTIIVQRTDENTDTHTLENASVTAVPFDREIRCMSGDYRVNLSGATSPDLDVEVYTMTPR